MALLQVGLKSCALQRFERVLRLGPGPYFEEAAAKLVEDLAFPLDQSWPQEPLFDLTGLPSTLRQQYAHKMGLHHLRRGELDAARSWLSGLSSRPQSRYLQATISLSQGNRDQARRHLLACLKLAARSSKVESAEWAELAALALARLDLAQGRWQSARRRYMAVPLGSPHFFRARQELAWLYLQQDDPEHALAQRVILQAPLFAKYFYPDGLMIEAAALFARCRLKRARDAALGLRKKMVQSLEKLALFLRRRPEERRYYLEAMAAAAGRSKALSRDHLQALLADAGFRRVFVVVRQLQRERGLLAQSGAAALQREVATELDRRLVGAQREAGEVTRRVLSALATELRALRQRGEEIIFEVERQAATVAINRRSGRSAETTAQDSSRGARGRGDRWPYRGELWSDEVNHLVVRLPSRCRGHGDSVPQNTSDVDH